ncbi:MAG: molybdenum ABC transporter ATP-binding protein [Gammaproteobacteria bacterium]|nr:molybdenum ABC transporter ATP-binding protein [Gammaproteobacteria bacterium]
MIELQYRVERTGFTLDANLELPLQGITGIFGVSGAGKTTLLRCIAGLEPAAAGRLVVAGNAWEDTAGGILLPVQRRNVGYVFQEPRLFEHLTVRANIEYGRKRRSGESGADLEHVVELLGLGALLERRPAALSGGEAQRVAIARALLCSPQLVLMDEPLAALDSARRNDILPFLDRLHAEAQIPIIYVSHNIDEVCRLCDHLVVMEEGGVAASGPLRDVLVQLDIPVLGGSNAGSVIEGRVDSYDTEDDLTCLRFSGGQLWVPGEAGPKGAGLRLRIQASDVSLCRARPEQSTILNILPAKVEAIQPGDGAAMLVRLLVGDDRIVARVTRRSIRELGLSEGESLFAQIKSVAVRTAAGLVPSG